MNTNYDKSYLAHYGVKGMKWGVRHTPIYTGGTRGHGQGTNSTKRGLSSKTKSRLKKVVIGAAVVGGLGLGAVAVKSGAFRNVSAIGKRSAESVLKRAETTAKFDSVTDIATVKSQYAKGAQKIDLLEAPKAYDTAKSTATKQTSSRVKQAPKINKKVTEESKAKVWKEYKDWKNLESSLKADRRNPNVTNTPELDQAIKGSENMVRRGNRQVTQQFGSDNGRYPTSYMKKGRSPRRIKRR